MCIFLELGRKAGLVQQREGDGRGAGISSIEILT